MKKTINMLAGGYMCTHCNKIDGDNSEGCSVCQREVEEPILDKLKSSPITLETIEQAIGLVVQMALRNRSKQTNFCSTLTIYEDMALDAAIEEFYVKLERKISD